MGEFTALKLNLSLETDFLSFRWSLGRDDPDDDDDDEDEEDEEDEEEEDEDEDEDELQFDGADEGDYLKRLLALTRVSDLPFCDKQVHYAANDEGTICRFAVYGRFRIESPFSNTRSLQEWSLSRAGILAASEIEMQEGTWNPIRTVYSFVPEDRSFAYLVVFERDFTGIGLDVSFRIEDFQDTDG